MGTTFSNDDGVNQNPNDPNLINKMLAKFDQDENYFRKLLFEELKTLNASILK